MSAPPKGLIKKIFYSISMLYSNYNVLVQLRRNDTPLYGFFWCNSMPITYIPSWVIALLNITKKSPSYICSPEASHYSIAPKKDWIKKNIFTIFVRCVSYIAFLVRRMTWMRHRRIKFKIMFSPFQWYTPTMTPECCPFAWTHRQIFFIYRNMIHFMYNLPGALTYIECTEEGIN